MNKNYMNNRIYFNLKKKKTILVKIKINKFKFNSKIHKKIKIQLYNKNNSKKKITQI